jgi:hypothetical protein
MDAQRCEPTRARDAFDRWRAPDTRHAKGPPWCEIHKLARTHAQHRMQISLDEEREMSIGAQAPITHQYIPRP